MITGQQKLGEIALPPVEASVEDSRQDNGQSWQAVLSEGCRSAKSLAPHPLSKVICAGQGELQRGRSWSLTGTWHGRHFAHGIRLQWKATAN